MPKLNTVFALLEFTNFNMYGITISRVLFDQECNFKRTVRFN